MRERSNSQSVTETINSEKGLSEHAHFLSPLAGRLTERWASLYLEIFGRNAFFPEARVRKLFGELVRVFIGCLKENSLDIYIENLREKGRIFSRIGVPFEEIILSLHLFEEACLEQFLSYYKDRSRLPELVSITEQLHSEGLAAFASSYFETVKAQLENISESLREENESLRSELERSRESVFSLAKNELASMQLLLSGVNQKMKTRVYQLGRIQRLIESLEGERQTPRLLKVASQQCLLLCPDGSDATFGFLDESRTRISLYHLESKADAECSLFRQIYRSELCTAIQEILLNEETKFAHLTELESVPKVLRSIAALKGHRDHLVLPLRKYEEVLGFLLLSVPPGDFFDKGNTKFFQRVANGIASALFSARLHAEAQRKDRFDEWLESVKKTDLFTASMERGLDHCLASLLQLSGAERASLMRFDSENRELRVFAAKGVQVFPIAGRAIKWGEGIAGLALKESKPIAVSRLEEPRKGILKGFWTEKKPGESRVKSLLCLPVIGRDRPLGVVNISTLSYFKEFEKSEIDMATQVVNRISEILQDLPPETLTAQTAQ